MVSFDAGVGEFEGAPPGEDVFVFCDVVWDAVGVPVVGAPAGAAPVVLELDVLEPVEFVLFVEGLAGGIAGFSSSLSLLSDPACRWSTGRSSFGSSSMTGAEYFLVFSGACSPARSHVPSAIQVWLSCPGCVMVNSPCDMPE